MIIKYDTCAHRDINVLKILMIDWSVLQLKKAFASLYSAF